jgi:hypothetical protein
MTTYTSLLPKTGQTTSYETGDDGDLEKGASRSFTVLDTGQYAGTTNIVLDAETEAKNNNCVQDNVTGLMYARYKSDTVGDYYTYTTGQMSWAKAIEYADAANAANFAGHNDWRVPNALELMAIFDWENGDLFSEWDGVNGNTWSSTTNPFFDTLAQYLDVASGNLANTAKTSNTFWVMLVRGDPVAPTPCPTSLDFEITGLLDATVYLQKIRDAILGVTPKTPGLLTWEIYLQEIRDAILLMYP